MRKYDGNYPENDGNEEIRERRKRAVEGYIIDINNKLVELIKYMHLDLPEIKSINKDRYGFDKSFNDGVKKTIIDAVMIGEEIENSHFDEIKKQVEEEVNRQKNKQKLDLFNRNPYRANGNFGTSGNCGTSGNYNINKKAENNAVAPPKTDWSRIDVSKDEKEKILASIRANPKSSVFSKEFKWNVSDFLSAFTYLEEIDSNYNGPFIVAVVNTKEKLEKFSKVRKLSDKIPQLYLGKFVLLSLYDITASSEEAKHIYVGLNYIGMSGRLEFDCVGTLGERKIKNYQKKLLMEYFDFMDIIYEPTNKELELQ
jgi:hypothetical protein